MDHCESTILSSDERARLRLSGSLSIFYCLLIWIHSVVVVVVCFVAIARMIWVAELLVMICIKIRRILKVCANPFMVTSIFFSLANIAIIDFDPFPVGKWPYQRNFFRPKILLLHQAASLFFLVSNSENVIVPLGTTYHPGYFFSLSSMSQNHWSVGQETLNLTIVCSQKKYNF